MHRVMRDSPYQAAALLPDTESLFVQGYMVTDDGPVERLFDDTTLLACIASRPVASPDAALPPCRPSPHRPARGWHHGNGRRIFRSPRALCPGGRWSRDQRCEMHDDGSVTLPIRAHNEAKCLSWKLGFADRAQVLAPDWLRREIKKTVYAMARLYHTPHKPADTAESGGSPAAACSLRLRE